MGFFGSIGKALGSVGKAIGKGAKSVGKIALGAANTALAATTGVSLLPQPAQATAADMVYTPAPINPGIAANQQYISNATAGASITGAAPGGQTWGEIIKGAAQVLSGNKPVQFEVGANQNTMPSWLLPVGVGGALLIGLMAVTKKGRR